MNIILRLLGAVFAMISLAGVIFAFIAYDRQMDGAFNMVGVKILTPQEFLKQIGE